MKPARPPGSPAARLVRSLALVLAAASVAGCGSFWPWGSSHPKRPDPPAVTAPIPARVAWSASVGPSGVGFAPVVVGDSVDAASRNGSVVRVDTASGKLVWRADAGKPLAAGVGSDGRTVAVAASDGTLIAFGADGKRKWATPLGAAATSVPAVGEGVVVVRTADSRVTAFDESTGSKRWSFQRQNPALVLRQTAVPTIVPGAVFVGLPGGRVVSLDLSNGALRWESAIALPHGSTEVERIADVVGAPVVSGHEVCAAAFQGKIACLDTDTGRPVWSRQLSSPTGLDADARLVAAADDQDVVQAFSRSGASLWKQDKLSRRGLSAPLSLGPVLVFGDVGGLVYLLSRDDGAIAGRFATDGTPIVAAPVAAGRMAIVQTTGGTLAAIALE